MKLETIEARQSPGAIHHKCHKQTEYIYAGVHWCEECEEEVAYCMTCGKAVAKEFENDEDAGRFPAICDRCYKKEQKNISTI